jgi:hypothetical protein
VGLRVGRGAIREKGGLLGGNHCSYSSRR